MSGSVVFQDGELRVRAVDFKRGRFLLEERTPDGFKRLRLCRGRGDLIRELMIFGASEAAFAAVERLPA